MSQEPSLLTPPPSPERRKLRMLRPGPPPAATDLLVRATPASVDEAVLDIAESALDSAASYDVRLGGVRLMLYAVSVFARPADTEADNLLRRFAMAPCYIEASVQEMQSAGFGVVPTGAHLDHFEILLIPDRHPDDPLLSLAELGPAARRLVQVCGYLQPNPSYAGNT